MTAGPQATAPGALAGAAVATLGLHVWIAVIVLPGALAGALTGVAAPAAGLAPAVLALGLVRRSAWLLLFAFPSAVAVAALAAPEVVSSHAYDGLRFAVVAVGLVAYLLSASALAAPRIPAPPTCSRLPPGEIVASARWRRRLRVYRGLAALSAAFPATFIYAVHFHPGNRAYLRALYPGRVEELSAALALLALAVWIGLFGFAFSGVLGAHRKGDRALSADLAALRAQASRGRPRPALYLGVAAAIVLTLLFAALRMQTRP